MIASFDNLFNPPSERTKALLREAMEGLMSLPEHDGASERMRMCPHSICERIDGERWWSCDLAPNFCQWACVLYDQDTCLMEGNTQRGIRVSGLECLTGRKTSEGAT